MGVTNCNDIRRSGDSRFLAVIFSSRPVLTTDLAVLAGDGSSINYCELPVLT